MHKSAPSVSVIVPAYNAQDTLPACLDALNAMSYRASEIIVFSDGSTDRTVEIAEASGARVMRNQESAQGPAHGRNIASRTATSDLLLFVDADVVIGHDCLEKLVAAMQQYDAAAVFGSYDNQPRSTRVAGLYCNLRHHYVHQNSAREASTFWSGVGLIERQVFLDLGGYDKELYAYPSIEDVELGMRLKETGHRIRLVPEAQAKHCKDWTAWRVWHTDIVRRALPWSRLLVEGKSEGADLNLTASERVKAFASLATFASLGVALFAPIALLAAIAFFAIYVYLNRGFISVLRNNLPTSQWIRATLMHLAYHTYSLGAFLWVVVAHAFKTAFVAASEERGRYPAQFDTAFFGCLAVLTLLFSWALIVHAAPAYFDDTANYLSGGEKIFDRVFSIFGGGTHAPAAGSVVSSAAVNGASVAVADPQPTASGPSAVRSIPYYVLTAALSAPGRSLVLLAVFQALVAAFYVVLHCRVERLKVLPILAIGAGLAVLTPVSLVAAFAVPDIFTVPVIGGISLLALRFEPIAPRMRIALILVVGLCISMHISFLPLAVALASVAVIWLAWSRRAVVHEAFPGALLAGLAIMLALTANLAGGLVGFGEATVAPKRLPLVLARSISDGPGRWYLASTCPTRHYAVCELWPDGRFPHNSGTILFDDEGILHAATDDQLDRIRAEEPEIVLNALRAYPMVQIANSLGAIGQQFVTFHPSDINFAREMRVDAEGVLRTDHVPRDPDWTITLIDQIQYLVIPLSAALLLFALAWVPRVQLPVVLLCLFGIAANMVICAVFSAVAGRYAMRVVWMVPLLAALYAASPVRAAIAGFGRKSRSGAQPVTAERT